MGKNTYNDRAKRPPAFFEKLIIVYLTLSAIVKEALAVRRIFSLVDMITKAKFSNSPSDFKIRLFG